MKLEIDIIYLTKQNKLLFIFSQDTYFNLLIKHTNFLFDLKKNLNNFFLEKSSLVKLQNLPFSNLKFTD